jgi:hypothetical protein
MTHNGNAEEDEKLWGHLRQVLLARDEYEREGHPSSQDLVAFAEEGKRTDIAQHVRSCEDCREQIEAIRRSLPVQVKESPLAFLHPVIQWLRGSGVRYAIPAALAGLLIFFLWDPLGMLRHDRPAPPSPELSASDSTASRGTVSLTLMPQISLRGPVTKRKPQLAIDNQTGFVSMTFLVRRSDMPLSPWSVTVVSPSGEQYTYGEEVSPVRSRAGLDTLRLTLAGELFNRSEGTYRILLTEVPSPASDIQHEVKYDVDVVEKK